MSIYECYAPPGIPGADVEERSRICINLPWHKLHNHTFSFIVSSVFGKFFLNFTDTNISPLHTTGSSCKGYYTGLYPRYSHEPMQVFCSGFCLTAFSKLSCMTKSRTEKPGLETIQVWGLLHSIFLIPTPHQASGIEDRAYYWLVYYSLKKCSTSTSTLTNTQISCCSFHYLNKVHSFA